MAGVSPSRSVVLLGDGDLPRAVEVALQRVGAQVRWLRRPPDREVAAALAERVDVVLVVSRDDIQALRLALLVEHARPGVPLIVTLFDRTVASQLRSAVPDCRVMSLADLVAPTLAGPCVAPELISLAPTPAGFAGVREGAGGLELVPLDQLRGSPRRRLGGWLRSALRPFDASARILIAGLAGFLAILVVDSVISGIVLHESPVEAFYRATKALVTVGPNQGVDVGHAWLRALSAVLMLAAVGFAAILTAGIVNRLLDPRLTGFAGRRAIPRLDHVVVVGLGQVGLRLCLLLRSLGLGVVAVERNLQAPNVPLAKRYGIPVVIGSGGDRFLLERLSLDRARALAATTSDDLENIAIAVAALAGRRDLRVILRAGDGDVTTETRSLFQIGVVRDLHRIAGDLLAASALGLEATGAATHNGETWLVFGDASARPFRTLFGTAEHANSSEPAAGG